MRFDWDIQPVILLEFILPTIILRQHAKQKGFILNWFDGFTGDKRISNHQIGG